MSDDELDRPAATWGKPDADGYAKCYYVDRILNKRIGKNGKLEYFLEWSDYTKEDCSWEPADNCLNCASLIEDYEKRAEEERQQKIAREIEYRPLRLFKQMYCPNGLKQLLALSNPVPEIDLNSIKVLDDDQDHKNLHLLSLPRILGINRSCSPRMYFVVKFDNLKEPIFASPNVVYERWPEVACRFYEEWINAHYHFD